MPSTTKNSDQKPNKRPSRRAAAGLTKQLETERIPPKSAPKFDSYQTAKAWLFDHVDHERLRVVEYNERIFGLDRMSRLLDLLGNPQNQIQCVHIAGTKGKGSTCAMLASMLSACGLTTGLYTSPHLNDLRERIQVNGHMAGYQDLTDVFQKISKAESKLGFSLTFFEILTASAFLHFAEQAVDIAVLETGLGGRLDCTNVCSPLVTGITSISYDHMNILGNDILDIAREKAGIFKAGVPAVSVEQTNPVAAVLREVAEAVGTTLQFVGKEIDFSYRFESNRELGPHTRVSLSGKNTRLEHLPVPLKGEHQAHNCGLALTVLDKLKECGFELPEDRIVEGLAATDLPGRMEQVWAGPRVFVDGAHNASSIQALIRALGAHIQYDSLVMIFGCGHDKDVSGMLKQVALGADKVIFTQAKNNPRRLEADDLFKKFNALSGKMSQKAPTLEGALKLASSAVTRDDIIVITGSFYLVGEARDYFHKLAVKRNKA
jgi:dihydrofolate synthase/folylpolyglutamate synthase